MDQESTNRRRASRLNVWLDCQFSVLIPEETFNPPVASAKVCDLSDRGAMLIVSVAPETYNRLLQKTRYCRINFPAGTGMPARVTGKAVWIQPETSGNTTTLKIGVFFEDCPTETREMIQEYIQSVAEDRSNS